MAAKLTMLRLGAELDKESYEWLAGMHPDILAAVEAEIAAGAKPSDLRLFTIRQTGRPDIAHRIEQAARHVAGQEPISALDRYGVKE